MKPSKTLPKIFLLFIFIVSNNCFAQREITKSEQPAEATSLNKLRINIIGVGYEREQKIGKTTTFYVGAGAEATYIYTYSTQATITYNSNGTANYTYTHNDQSKLRLYPALNTGIRHYYNFNRRIQKGKSTLNNAAGYVSFDVTGLLPINNKDGINYQVNLGPMWGFQTNAGKKMNFELCLGPGVAINSSQTFFYGIGGKIGFSFLL